MQMHRCLLYYFRETFVYPITVFVVNVDVCMIHRVAMSWTYRFLGLVHPLRGAFINIEFHKTLPAV